MNFKDFKGLKFIGNIKDKYKIAEVLGRGTFGEVRKCQHKQAKVKLAIKIISKNKVENNETFKALMENELQILEDISHPNIVRIFELLHDENNYYIVSELMRHGELFELANKRENSEEGGLTEDEIHTITKEIFLALNFMHT